MTCILFCNWNNRLSDIGIICLPPAALLSKYRPLKTCISRPLILKILICAASQPVEKYFQLHLDHHEALRLSIKTLLIITVTLKGAFTKLVLISPQPAEKKQLKTKMFSFSRGCQGDFFLLLLRSEVHGIFHPFPHIVGERYLKWCLNHNIISACCFR